MLSHLHLFLKLFKSVRSERIAIGIYFITPASEPIFPTYHSQKEKEKNKGRIVENIHVQLPGDHTKAT